MNCNQTWYFFIKCYICIMFMVKTEVLCSTKNSNFDNAVHDQIALMSLKTNCLRPSCNATNIRKPINNSKSQQISDETTSQEPTITLHLNLSEPTNQPFSKNRMIKTTLTPTFTYPSSNTTSKPGTNATTNLNTTHTIGHNATAGTNNASQKPTDSNTRKLNASFLSKPSNNIATNLNNTATPSLNDDVKNHINNNSITNIRNKAATNLINIATTNLNNDTFTNLRNYSTSKPNANVTGKKNANTYPSGETTTPTTTKTDGNAATTNLSSNNATFTKTTHSYHLTDLESTYVETGSKEINEDIVYNYHENFDLSHKDVNMVQHDNLLKQNLSDANSTANSENKDTHSNGWIYELGSGVLIVIAALVFRLIYKCSRSRRLRTTELKSNDTELKEIHLESYVPRDTLE